MTATTTRNVARLNRLVKGGIGWALLLVVIVSLLVVGTTRDSGPQTQQDRIDSVARRLACPTCDGESVYVSRAPAAESIRGEIARQVAGGQRSDDEIVGYIEERFGGQVLLVPRATGFDALIWALPVIVGVCAIAALGFAFRRWRLQAGLVSGPTDDDRELVDRARVDEARRGEQ